jgi:hypothetical protein
VQGCVGHQNGLRVRGVGSGDERTRIVRRESAHLGRGEDAAAGDGHRIEPSPGEKLLEAPRDVGGIGGGDRYSPKPKRPHGGDERERGARHGEAESILQLRGLGLRAVPPIDETAARARPYDRRDARRKPAGALEQPLGAAHVEQRVLAVGVLADVGVHHLEGRGTRETLIEQAEIALGAVTGVKDPDPLELARHLHPNPLASGTIDVIIRHTSRSGGRGS